MCTVLTEYHATSDPALRRLARSGRSSRTLTAVGHASAVRTAMVLLFAVNLVMSAAAQGVPRAEIVAPPNGAKLRRGARLAVQVRVESGDDPLAAWTLSLLGPLATEEEEPGPGSSEQEIASGGELPPDGVVWELTAAGLTAATWYRLRLRVATEAGARAETDVALFVPDLQYSLIPLDPGNFSVGQPAGLALDSTGDLVAVAGPGFEEVRIINAATGNRRKFPIPLASSEGQKLSRDGKRFFFRGSFPQGAGILFALGFLDTGDGSLTVGPAAPSPLFGVNRSGDRVVFQDVVRGEEALFLAYFLFTQADGEIRQLTTDPNAIVERPRPSYCPQQLGTAPLLSADGSHVVVITGATLGLVADDPAVGCHIFTYDVARATWRLAAELPTGIIVDVPALSDDGRWLSFSSRHTQDPGFPRTLPAVADLETGMVEFIQLPVDYTPTFDSVISGDGGKLLLTTLAELDPRVGNSDQNVELFVMDRAAGTFMQLTDTIGGIGPMSGSCARYRPEFNVDARVAAFSFKVFSAELCTLDGSQRNGADGLAFNRVRVVRRRHGNGAPLMSPVSAARMRAGDPLELVVGATDPDNDPIYLFAQVVGGLDVPPGSEFTDTGNGIGILTWPTAQENAGLYVVRFAAFDEGGDEVFRDAEIAVCDPVLLQTDAHSVASAIFLPNPPAQCLDGDLNRDGRVSAPDLTLAVLDRK
jgi:hypothetical protein